MRDRARSATGGVCFAFSISVLFCPGCERASAEGECRICENWRAYRDISVWCHLLTRKDHDVSQLNCREVRLCLRHDTAAHKKGSTQKDSKNYFVAVFWVIEYPDQTDYDFVDSWVEHVTPKINQFSRIMLSVAQPIQGLKILVFI